MARKWQELKSKMSPERRGRIAERVRQMNQQLLLAELRKLAGMTQAELAEEMGVQQATVSQMESQDDMQVSTLRRIVEALGGELEITAILPTGRITVAPFSRASER